MSGRNVGRSLSETLSTSKNRTKHTPRKLGVRALRAAEGLRIDLDGAAPDSILDLEIANVLKKYGPVIRQIQREKMETDPGLAQRILEETDKLHGIKHEDALFEESFSDPPTEPEIEAGEAALDVFK